LIAPTPESTIDHQQPDEHLQPDQRNLSVTDVLDRLESVTAKRNGLTIGDVVSAFGPRAYGPIIFVIGLVSTSPLGSIPGASILLASLLILICAQMLIRGSIPWTPTWLERRGVSGDRARRGLEAIRPIARKLQTVVKPRWAPLASGAARAGIALVCIALALTMYPLALVPWGVLPPSLAITLLGLGLLSHDGAVTGGGLALALSSAALLCWTFW